MAISFQLNPRTGCEIYRDGTLIEIVPVKGHVERLKELGYVAPKRGAWSKKRLQAKEAGR